MTAYQHRCSSDKISYLSTLYPNLLKGTLQPCGFNSIFVPITPKCVFIAPPLLWSLHIYSYQPTTHLLKVLMYFILIILEPNYSSPSRPKTDFPLPFFTSVKRISIQLPNSEHWNYPWSLFLLNVSQNLSSHVCLYSHRLNPWTITLCFLKETW